MRTRWTALPSRRRARPRLECLEDRTAPALLSVTSALDTHEEGRLTLREAVALANADAAGGQSDTIAFDHHLGNVTITANGVGTGAGGHGGGLYVEVTTPVLPVLHNTLVAGNFAGIEGY
jgi:hypothetical protein